MTVYLEKMYLSTALGYVTPGASATLIEPRGDVDCRVLAFPLFCGA
jgi:hypothetical protein